MVSTTIVEPDAIPTLTCSECGALWVACRPGTAADARSSPNPKVLELFRCEEDPMVLWCEKHDPMRRPQAKRRGAR